MTPEQRMRRELNLVGETLRQEMRDAMPAFGGAHFDEIDEVEEALASLLNTMRDWPEALVRVAAAGDTCPRCAQSGDCACPPARACLTAFSRRELEAAIERLGAQVSHLYSCETCLPGDPCPAYAAI